MKDRAVKDKFSKMCCEHSMKWYGWGSPVGFSVFLATVIGSTCLLYYMFW